MLSTRYLLAKLKELDYQINLHEKDNPEFTAHLTRLKASYLKEIERRKDDKPPRESEEVVKEPFKGVKYWRK